jgi:hypothetical protein
MTTAISMKSKGAQPVAHEGSRDAREPAYLGRALEDLERRLLRALGIARRAVPVLAEDGYRDEEDPQDSFGPDKPIAETAMLLYVASAVAERSEIRDAIDELSALVAKHARSHRTACAVAMNPAIGLQLAMSHVLLNRLGRPDARFDRLLGLCVESLAGDGQEFVPHRALEKMWIKSLWDGKPPGVAFDTAAPCRGRGTNCSPSPKPSWRAA